MPPGNPTSFRLSDEALRMLAELEGSLGVKRTAVVELAIRQLYRKEGKDRKPPKKPGKSG
jgi:predicted transcriptional regulator